MNNKLTLIAGLWLAATFAGAGVTRTPEEWQGTGDMNGDGDRDVVVVDRVTGIYRTGYTQPDGTLAWAAGRPSGVEQVSGLAVGRFLHLDRDALAFTSLAANRVNVVDAISPTQATPPINVFPATVGPELLIGLDIPAGPGNTGHDDLFVSSVANDPPSPYYGTMIRATGVAFSDLLSASLASRALALDRVQLKAGGPRLAGVLLAGAPEPSWIGINVSGVPFTQATAEGLPDVEEFLHGFFANSAWSQFLFWTRGGSNLVLRPVLENAPDDFGFGAGAVFAMDSSLRQVLTVPGAADTRLLMIFGEGETAGVYAFDGTNAPVLVESFSAPAGEAFTGAGALGEGNMMLLSGAGGRSEHFQRWDRSGNGYVAGASGHLPGLNPLGNTGNVFLFKKRPFVHPEPTLVATLNAADWSSGLNLSDPNNVRVFAESYVDEARGLDDPALRQLGVSPDGGAFGLANQIQETFSLLSFRPAIGREIAEVTISPPPGRYPQGLAVRLSTPEPSAQVFYRLGDDQVWQSYNGPVPLYKNTTVSYYAKLGLGALKSAIRRADYSFDRETDDVDTDGDGVPDYVELGYDWNHNGVPDHEEYGQDLATVHSDKDSDGDGYSDLAEILAGTNMYDPASQPSNEPRLEEFAAFDWYVVPQSLPGFLPGLAGCQTGTVARAYNLAGDLMRTASSDLAEGFGYARFVDLFADASQRFYVAATEPHFDLRTNDLTWPEGADTRIGRELLRLTPIPELAAGLMVDYEFGGGTLLEEAAQWVQAARTAEGDIEPPFVVEFMDHRDTLTALLVERKAEALLRQRELIESDARITLFPFRPQDAGRVRPPQDLLLSLETNLLTQAGEPDPLFPAHRLTGLYETFSGIATNPPSAPLQALVNLTADIYRINAASNNAAPGVFPSPVDTVRHFLETGVLHSNYLAVAGWDEVDLAEAQEGVAQSLASSLARPFETVVLRVRSGSFASSDCAVLETMTGAPRSLVLADGAPFKFPQAFQLVPGTLVEVRGYTDPEPVCGWSAIEVVTLDVFAFPAVSPMDQDGDLLSDDWECLFLTGDPNGDDDGDGIGNLQEFFDGTDPSDASSKGDQAADLQPPQIHIGAGFGGELQLTWFWPEAYAGLIDFKLLATGALGQSFQAAPGAVEHLGGGNFRMVPADTAATSQYYQLQMTLAGALPAVQ